MCVLRFLLANYGTYIAFGIPSNSVDVFRLTGICQLTPNSTQALQAAQIVERKCSTPTSSVTFSIRRFNSQDDLALVLRGRDGDPPITP
jgi:hypothetical protein